MREFEKSGMWANLGARIVDVRPGEVVVEATLTPEAHGFLSARGTIVHGGALAALADMALATAAAALVKEGETVATVDLKVDFLRPGRPGRLLARAAMRKRAQHLGFSQATVEQEDGTVVAEARAVLAFLGA